MPPTARSSRPTSGPEPPRRARTSPPEPSRAEPVRTCIGCRTRRPQSALVRIALTQGTLVESRTAPGRGAWLCRGSIACLETAVRRKAFPRALRAPIAEAAIEGLRSSFGRAGPQVADWNAAGSSAPRSPST